MPGYTNNPKSVYSAVKGYIDDAASFPGDAKLGFRVRPEDVPNRTIELAVPPNPTLAQIQQLRNAIEYANQQGIKLNITKVK
jgi:filamentous hemagglutinin